jgi:hypothetical protein
MKNCVRDIPCLYSRNKEGRMILSDVNFLNQIGNINFFQVGIEHVAIFEGGNIFHCIEIRNQLHFYIEAVHGKENIVTVPYLPGYDHCLIYKDVVLFFAVKIIEFVNCHFTKGLEEYGKFNAGEKAVYIIHFR